MKHIKKFNENIDEDGHSISSLINTSKRLKSLKDGWLDGEGLAPNKDAISKLLNKMAEYPHHKIPTPAIIPTPEGNVVLEWNKISSMPSVDINLSTWEAEFSDMGDNEMSFDLSEDSEWDNLFNYLLDKIKK